MKFSVIVPCHNAERYITACLDSIANQSLVPHEIIVIDDGSADHSVAVANSHGLELRWLRTPNLGGAGARNAAINLASGDWLAFLDADDVWYPNHLERAAEIIGRREVVGFINHYDRMRADGGEIEVRTCRVGTIVEGEGFDDYLELFTRYRHFVGMSACVIKASRARELGGFDESLQRRHDIEFWLRVVRGQPWVFDSQSTSAYRKHCIGSLSANDAAAAVDGFRAFHRHREHAADSGCIDAILKERARSALARSFNSGNPVWRERAFEHAFEYLSPKNKLVFGLSRRVPSLFRVLKVLA